MGWRKRREFRQVLGGDSKQQIETDLLCRGRDGPYKLLCQVCDLLLATGPIVCDSTTNSRDWELPKLEEQDVVPWPAPI